MVSSQNISEHLEEHNEEPHLQQHLILTVKMQSGKKFLSKHLEKIKTIIVNVY